MSGINGPKISPTMPKSGYDEQSKILELSLKLETEMSEKITDFVSNLLGNKELNELIMRSLSKSAYSKRAEMKTRALTIIKNNLSSFLKDDSLFSVFVQRKNLSGKIIEFIYNKLPNCFARINAGFPLRGREVIVNESAALAGKCIDFIELPYEEIKTELKYIVRGGKRPQKSVKHKQSTNEKLQGLKEALAPNGAAKAAEAKKAQTARRMRRANVEVRTPKAHAPRATDGKEVKVKIEVPKVEVKRPPKIRG